MVIFGGCTHGEAYNDVWQLRNVAGQALWEQLHTTGMDVDVGRNRHPCKLFCMQLAEHYAMKALLGLWPPVS